MPCRYLLEHDGHSVLRRHSLIGEHRTQTSQMILGVTDGVRVDVYPCADDAIIDALADVSAMPS
jgi:hypothetical protein